ncbi:exosome complex exonuclease [Paramyrothecium foliicola]|nr:exosome complex exonuclease [Paramyrothecium foliicola]
MGISSQHLGALPVAGIARIYGSSAHFDTMAIPTLQSLERPQDFQEMVRRDRGDDCLSCRIIGSGAFLGLGAYSYFSGMSQLEKQQQAILKSKSMFGMRSRKAGIAVISLGFVWAGFWRAIK